MKLIIIIFTLFSGQLLASSWPNQMYTIDKLFYEQFAAMRTYIQNLKINYPYKEFENKIIFYSEGNLSQEKIFTISLQRQFGENYIKEELTLHTPWGENEYFTLERWGQNVRPTVFRNLYNFSITFPQNVTATAISFRKLRIYQRVENTPFSQYSNHQFLDHNLEIHHLEKTEESRLLSKFWYQCSACSGEPLIAEMDTRAQYNGNLNYYVGSPANLVTPRDFYIMANRHYLSGIQRQFQSIPQLGQDKFNWPFVE